MEELTIDVKSSLHRWYLMSERAGNFDPRLDYITKLFFEHESLIDIDLPIDDTEKENAENKAAEDRRLSYFDDAGIFEKHNTQSYFTMISNIIKYEYRGRRHDWRNNTMTAG